MVDSTFIYSLSEQTQFLLSVIMSLNRRVRVQCNTNTEKITLKRIIVLQHIRIIIFFLCAYECSSVPLKYKLFKRLEKKVAREETLQRVKIVYTKFQYKYVIIYQYKIKSLRALQHIHQYKILRTKNPTRLLMRDSKY